MPPTASASSGVAVDVELAAEVLQAGVALAADQAHEAQHAGAQHHVGGRDAGDVAARRRHAAAVEARAPCRSSSLPRRSRSKRTTPLQVGQPLGDGVLVEPGEDPLDGGRPDLVAGDQREQVVVARSPDRRDQRLGRRRRRRTRRPRPGRPCAAARDRRSRPSYLRSSRRAAWSRARRPVTLAGRWVRGAIRGAAPRPVQAGERRPAPAPGPGAGATARGTPRAPSSSNGVAGQRPADVLGHVVVAEATPRRGRRGPARAPRRWSTPRCPGRRAQPPVGLLVRQPGRCARATSATRAAVDQRRERAGSTCSRSHSQDGIVRSVSGVGCTHSRRLARPGPGARSPNRCTSIRKPANASWPVTFCSMIAGHQRLHHQAAAAEPPVRRAAARPRRAPGAAARSRSGRRRRRAGRAPTPAPTPRPRPRPRRAPRRRPGRASTTQRRRALGGADAAPVRPAGVEAVRRVAGAAAMVHEDPADRARPLGSPDARLARR